MESLSSHNLTLLPYFPLPVKVLFLEISSYSLLKRLRKDEHGCKSNNNSNTDTGVNVPIHVKKLCKVSEYVYLNLWIDWFINLSVFYFKDETPPFWRGLYTALQWFRSLVSISCISHCPFCIHHLYGSMIAMHYMFWNVYTASTNHLEWDAFKCIKPALPAPIACFNQGHNSI